MSSNRLDSFTLAVIHSSLIGIARDMKILTMRTAYTELWKEQGDLSCCLMDAAGDIIAQDPNGFPIHGRHNRETVLYQGRQSGAHSNIRSGSRQSL